MHGFHGTFAWLHPDRQTLINMLGWLEDNEVDDPCITQFGRHLHCTLYSHGYEIHVPRIRLERPIVIRPDQLKYTNRQGRFMIEFDTPTIKNYAKKLYQQIPGFNVQEWEQKYIAHMVLGISPRKRNLKKPIDFDIVLSGQNSSPRIRTRADIVEELKSKKTPQSQKNHIVKLMES